MILVSSTLDNCILSLLVAVTFGAATMATPQFTIRFLFFFPCPLIKQRGKFLAVTRLNYHIFSIVFSLALFILKQI